MMEEPWLGGCGRVKGWSVRKIYTPEPNQQNLRLGEVCRVSGRASQGTEKGELGSGRKEESVLSDTDAVLEKHHLPTPT